MANVSAQKQSDNSPKSTANHADDRNGIKMPAVQILQQQPAIQRKKNNTGLPDNLKTGIETLSGFSMNDVKVHYNSAKPAQLQAFAYAQGTDIHIGPGQEKHLPHEAWHVAQQKQGRVQPTMQMKAATAANDDKGLESEADTMSAQAVNVGQLAKMGDTGRIISTVSSRSNSTVIMQLYTASPRDKIALRTALSKWRKAITDENPAEDAVESIVDALIEYCDNHVQAISIIKNVDYDTWTKAEASKIPAATLFATATPSVAKKAPAKRPLTPTDLAQKAIRDTVPDKKHLFTDPDIDTVIALHTASPGDGWAKAVTDTLRTINERIAAAEKAAEIAILKTRTDALRTPEFLANPICVAIWDSAKASAGASGKYELQTGYPAGDLLAAWTAWRTFQRAVAAADPPLTTFATRAIGNDGVAKDKSTRRDIAERRFTHQINFSVTWKGNEQMHHVGLAGTENGAFGRR